jgi:hypothetical protein
LLRWGTKGTLVSDGFAFDGVFNAVSGVLLRDSFSATTDDVCILSLSVAPVWDPGLILVWNEPINVHKELSDEDLTPVSTLVLRRCTPMQRQLTNTAGLTDDRVGSTKFLRGEGVAIVKLPKMKADTISSSISGPDFG